MNCFLIHWSRLLGVSGLLLAGCHGLQAVPVFPGAVGYGTDTLAAREAPATSIYRVKNLNNSGADSLREFVENRTGPRVIIFDVSGVIALQSEIVVRDDSFGNHGNLIIAGQTAPPPGITLKNFGINVRSHDVLVQHIAIRPGNLVPAANPTAPDLGFDNKDCIKVEAVAGATTQNIVFDHVTCTWAMDEIASVWGKPLNSPPNTAAGFIQDVTFSNCIFARPILNGEPSADGTGSIRVHSKGTHGYGPIVGTNSQRTSLIGNLMAFNFARNPLIRSTTAGGEVVNNLIYHPGIYETSAIAIGNLSGAAPNAVSVVGNVIIRQPDGYTLLRTPAVKNVGTAETPIWQYPPAASSTLNGYHNEAVFVMNTGDNVLKPGAGLYMTGNSLFNGSTGTWSAPGTEWTTNFYGEGSGSVKIETLTTNPYVNSGGTTWTPLPSSAVKDHVLATAGKQPLYRDSLDTTLINDVAAGGGNFLERLSDVGADPWSAVSASNTRELSLPLDPTADSDGDTYKNFEEWLHGIANLVEGKRASSTLNVKTNIWEGFADGNADGWTPIGFTDWAVVSQVYRQQCRVDGARAVFDRTNWADQSIQARLRPIEFNGSNRFVALYARHRDFNNSYYVTMRGAPTNAIEIKKIFNGDASTILGSYAFTPPLNVWTTLRLEVSGTTAVSLKVYINDGTTPIIDATDNDQSKPLPSGQIGLGTYYATADFDNVYASATPTKRP